MSRRRRTRHRRSKGTSYWLIAVQVLVLTGVLVFLIVFRDYLSTTASRVVAGLGKGDLKVEERPEGEGKPSPEGDRMPPALGTGGDAGSTERDGDE